MQAQRQKQEEARRMIVDEEVPFTHEDLFFSRTDSRGMILSGNSVFQRISHYSWEELLGKPHNVIRHPDMPRAVFWLLWDTIKRGEPIGAYVKNRAKDGRYYWVFAIVTPVGGEYLSVRLKPASAFFAVVQKEYKALVKAEQQHQLKPEESAAKLLQRLQELGFEDYGVFMATALAAEMNEHRRATAQDEHEVLHGFETLISGARAQLEHAQQIFSAYTVSQYVPLNLQVQAAQLREAGATIGVISNNYTDISGGIREQMQQFMLSAQQMFATISQGMFLTGVAGAQHEMLCCFAQDSDEQMRAQETGFLQDQARAYQKKAAEGLRDIIRHAQHFRQDCADIKRLAAALEVIRMMGKVETARLEADAQGSLHDLIDGLDYFQKEVVRGLKEIDTISQDICRRTQQLLADDGE
jgi:aerotaxis receptor